jgi:hypothetical protein
MPPMTRARSAAAETCRRYGGSRTPGVRTPIPFTLRSIFSILRAIDADTARNVYLERQRETHSLTSREAQTDLWMKPLKVEILNGENTCG